MRTVAPVGASRPAARTGGVVRCRPSAHAARSRTGRLRPGREPGSRGSARPLPLPRRLSGGSTPTTHVSTARAGSTAMDAQPRWSVAQLRRHSAAGCIPPRGVARRQILPVLSSLRLARRRLGALDASPSLRDGPLVDVRNRFARLRSRRASARQPGRPAHRGANQRRGSPLRQSGTHRGRVRTASGRVLVLALG